ncbi:hypothetical protein O181_055297 [Austropuccinia psidii MF-1]|uniref:Uncharacterized protein n=1 Tax=Austropuccinia psidii MF-1 TaxID=1389203 RepID=A0A9Q3EDD4_9BASI|nr:hypothetical protein [Austropuccinia psidii MF-1]
MNCARAFGPAVVTGFSEYHWIYWLGPTIGSLSAAAIYAFMKRFEYWKWNEGQDTDVFSSSPQLFVTVSAVEEEVTGDSITCPVQVVPNNRNPGIKV